MAIVSGSRAGRLRALAHTHERAHEEARQFGANQSKGKKRVLSCQWGAGELDLCASSSHRRFHLSKKLTPKLMSCLLAQDIESRLIGVTQY